MLLKVVSAFTVFVAAAVGFVLLTKDGTTPGGAAGQVGTAGIGADAGEGPGAPPALANGAGDSGPLTEPPRIDSTPTESSLPPGPTAKPEVEPGIIEGTLQYAVGKAPVAAGLVRLADFETGELIEGPEGLSNAEGRFRLEPVLPGMYTVTTTFKDERLRAEVGAAHVADGQKVYIGELAVYRGITITGRVVDIESRNPVARAEVTAWQPSAVEYGEPGLHALVTGPDGNFVLPGPFMPGEVFLTASHDLFAAREPPARWYLDTEDVTDAEIAVHRAWTLTGRVLTPERSPASATVELIAGSYRICCSDTDADGQFEVRDALFRLGLQSAQLPTRIYAYAIADGYRGAFGEFTIDDIRRGISRDIVLEEGGAVAGRITGPDGLPLSGVRVSVWPETGNRFDNLRETTTEVDGRFRIAGLDDGPHVLEPQSPVDGLVPASQSTSFTVIDRSTHDAFEIRYQSGLAISGTAAAEKDEAPLTDRLVTLHHPDWLYPREVATDNKGAFSFEPIPEGTYSVSLRGYSWDDQRPPVTEDNVVAGFQEVRFRVDEEPEDGTIEIRIFDSNTGRPIADEILLTMLYTRFGYPKNDALELEPNEEGVIVLEGLPRVEMRLVVEALGYARRQLTASLVSPLVDVAPELFLEASLHSGRHVNGKVIDERGYPIEGARIDARLVLAPGEELPGGLGHSRLDGNFRLRTVSPEAKFITAVAEGYAPVAAPIPPGPTPIQHVRIVMIGGASVGGLALYEDGSAAAGEEIQLNGAITSHYATTDPSGAFQFDNVEDGPFELALPTGEPLGSGTIVEASTLGGLEVILPR